MPETKKMMVVDNPLITVTGIVVPVKWDKNGRAIAVSIATFEEHEYLIDPSNEIGNELCSLVRKKIKVAGSLGPSIKDKRAITVHAYELLENSDSDINVGIDQFGSQGIQKRT